MVNRDDNEYLLRCNPMYCEGPLTVGLDWPPRGGGDVPLDAQARRAKLEKQRERHKDSPAKLAEVEEKLARLDARLRAAGG